MGRTSRPYMRQKDLWKFNSVAAKKGIGQKDLFSQLADRLEKDDSIIVGKRKKGLFDIEL